ncbi:MAG TPA: signal recognition particle-docking protein FtsY [Acidimicrobiales bacterium]|nr:signal recognition particle-docking protein FtsY [Acidimicrobiales bacterium]
MIALYIIIGVLVVLTATVVITRRRRGSHRALVAPPARAAMPEVLVTEHAPIPTLEEISLGDRLSSSRGVFDRVRSFSGGELSPEQLDVVEEVLLRSDVGVATTTAILEELREHGAPEGVVAALRTILLGSLTGDRSTVTSADAGRVAVWLFVGVNGVGKTTTIGKLAKRHHDEGRRVMLAAGDTFRAAAADQLEQWATRTDSEIVRANEGADPGSVVHDAIGRASARDLDLVLADTAGRRANSTNLLDELAKVRRVADREPGQVLETLLVLDATTGQNALSQAREFLAAASVTGIVLTKLDGTARGGIVVAIERDLGIPVKFIGVGEGVDDLIVFDPEEFVDSLLGASR